MSEIIDIINPLNDEDGTKATFRTWLKNVGDNVVENEAIAEIETDKVTLEVHAPCDGILIETLSVIDENVVKGALLAKISKKIAGDNGVIAEIITVEDIYVTEKIVEPTKNGYSLDNRQRDFSPAVRKLLVEYALDSTAINGTGKNGRITKCDIVNYVQNPNVVSQSVEPQTINTINNNDMPSIMEPHSNMRRAIASHMQHSVTTAPHVTAVFEADLTAIINHRKANKQIYSEHGVNLSFTAYFIAATVAALQAVPKVNSKWHDDALEIFSCLNIGIGTALGDEGLIVPVLHNAQDMNLMGIAKRLQKLIQNARDSKLKPADMRNGTFTISNHGTSGSLIATPIIINQPQSAILGIGKMQKRPIVMEVDGADVLAIKPMCYISLTIDHRVLDGHQTNMFLSHFVGVIESWK
ncbi:MAG: 2-oxo acid dehydrogenase subunit E2 [Rhizobiales bacterium]|nr:2-oxo acid dehydrogenase subunit E2 [Hyphomicrobiales bacterium]